MRVSSLPYARIARAIPEHGLKAILEWVEFCAANALDGVEIAEAWLRLLPAEDVQQLIDLLSQLPIEVSALNAFSAQPNQPAGPQREEAVHEIARYLELAAQLGTSLVVIGSGNWAYYERYRMSRQEAVNNAVATLEACVPLAAAKGIRLVLENHPGWLPLRAEVAEQMLERLPSEHVAMNFDTGSAYREGQSPQDFLERDVLVRRTAYVHLKNIRFEGGIEAGRWNQTQPFEQSDVDYDYIFSRLAAAGFDGWISYESDREIGMVGIVAGAEFVRRMWSGVAVRDGSIRR
ncbi:MAG: sugar phosphate isomerase/epimerase [Planctomycetes bacterium]|nr:sugar phosphate isomerase/epimerase [Planctomycetota bacterium]